VRHGGGRTYRAQDERLYLRRRETIDHLPEEVALPAPERTDENDARPRLQQVDDARHIAIVADDAFVIPDVSHARAAPH
ncbi:hypothetical protein, partial [Clavibacter michiganensis]|uniref:hypothetical protein n=1 Tax=Clavibacter michiganensis TaxID=28447 RepID=UPI0029305531